MTSKKGGIPSEKNPMTLGEKTGFSMGERDRKTEALDKQVYGYILSHGSVTVGCIARQLKRKHETIARSVLRLEEKGEIYAENDGTHKYWTVRPKSPLERVRPAPSEMGVKKGFCSDPYGAPSGEHSRARSSSERIPRKGFVLWPSTKGSQIGREWVRIHANGVYKVGIEQVGDFRPYHKDTDESIEWKTTPFGKSTAYNGKVFLHQGDVVAFSIRSVMGCKTKVLKVLLVYVHPRYCWHDGSNNTAVMEFRQQVSDVLDLLELHGWRFDRDSIEFDGELHTALNDMELGKQVGQYHSLPGDPLHFDHSHGVPEVEIYGNDPETVEMMVQLPNIIKAFGVSIHALNVNLAEVVDIQSKLTLLVAGSMTKTEEPTEVKPMDPDFRMYG